MFVCFAVFGFLCLFVGLFVFGWFASFVVCLCACLIFVVFVVVCALK